MIDWNIAISVVVGMLLFCAIIDPGVQKFLEYSGCFLLCIALGILIILGLYYIEQTPLNPLVQLFSLTLGFLFIYIILAVCFLVLSYSCKMIKKENGIKSKLMNSFLIGFTTLSILSFLTRWNTALIAFLSFLSVYFYYKYPNNRFSEFLQRRGIQL